MAESADNPAKGEGNQLPWCERVAMLSIHPDAATREDIARLASELMATKRRLRLQSRRERKGCR